MEYEYQLIHCDSAYAFTDEKYMSRSISEVVHAWRNCVEVSIAELARRSGVDRKYISALEKGKIKHPSEEKLARIAAGLEMPLMDLVLKSIPVRLSEEERRLREWQENVASDPSPQVQRLLRRARGESLD